MLSAIIKWAIARRWLSSAIVLTFWIFHHHPDAPGCLSYFAPQVEIQTESPGLAQEGPITGNSTD